MIIQCKNWSREKKIHEKHIFQLYGTVVLAKLQYERSGYNVQGVFITTTELSQKAKEIAEYLNVSVMEKYTPGEYPRIKCNINQTTGEYIYHLPWDQQYDSVIIDKNKGECYAFTIEEAESKGFRHAKKYMFDE